MRQTFFGVMTLTLLLINMLMLVFSVQPVNANGTIYIRADGSVDPPTAPIQRVGDLYILASNINESIVIERNDIVVDGAGYVLQSNGGTGLALTHRTNVTIKNFQIMGFLVGIRLENSNDCSVYYNNIENNGYHGILLQYSNNNTILGNNATTNNYGFYLQESEGNTLSKNIATNNAYEAIYLVHSNSNLVSRNTAIGNNNGFVTLDSNRNQFADNVAESNKVNGIKIENTSDTSLNYNIVRNNGEYGVCLNSSVMCTLCGNAMSGNKYNFGVYGTRSSDSDNTIDFTNMADGKPIYYLKNASNIVINSWTNAATIYAINCTDVTISNLNLTSNAHGIFLWNTNNSRIENITASNNHYGISLHNCFADQDILWWDPWNPIGLFGIIWSNITRNYYGVHMYDCHDYIIAENTVTNNMDDGIRLSLSDDNLIVDNIALNNKNGFVLDRSNSNWLATWWVPPRVVNTAANNTKCGIYAWNSSNNQIFSNEAVNNGDCGIYLQCCNNSRVDSNIVSGNSRGIYVDGKQFLEGIGYVLLSANNTLSGNQASNNLYHGILLIDSPFTDFSGNKAMNNSFIGIGIFGSDNSRVSGNVMKGNKYNFQFFWGYRWYYATDGTVVHEHHGFDITLDSSNTADGKPIYYLKNSSNVVLDSSTDAATIYVVDSINVTIRDLILAKNNFGVFLWNTTNSRVENVVAKYNRWGIDLENSCNVTVCRNTVADNEWQGIQLTGTGNCAVAENIISNNSKRGGILVDGSLNLVSDNIITRNGDGTFQMGGITVLKGNNVLSGNTLKNNSPYDIRVSSGGNKLFHNNILDNEVADQGGSSWDNGAEGNYWGAEGLEDYDGNGIEDAPHIIDEGSRDNFPLKEPWSPLKVFYINVTSVAKIFEVSVASNSTTGNLTFSQPDKQISFKTTGPNGTFGFYNITIPKELLRTSDQWIITVHGEEATPVISENETHTSLYFTFTHSTKTINIRGNDPIDNTAPIANAGLNQTVYENTIVTFNGSASGDNSGIARYVWAFKDETIQTLDGVSPSYNFRSPGTYSVMLNVTDLRGNWDTATTTVVVLAIPIWLRWWLWAMVTLVFITFGFSYMVFGYRGREGTYEKLQKLIRKQVKGVITEEVFDEKLEELRKEVDDDTRALIDEYLPPLRAYEEALRFVKRKKTKRK